MPEQELSPADATLARLARLTAMRPGAPLRADDWNALVDAVRALAEQARARALASDGALAAGYAPAEHEHPGVVDLEWFDPSTRALLEGRGGPDSSTGSRPEFTVRDDLQRLDRNVADLRGGLDDVRRDLAGLRELVVQLRDEVIGGGRDLGKLKLRIDALREVEVGVGRIGRDFERLGGRLDEVLTLRERLGEVDPAGLERRLVDLEKLRGQLVGESAVPDLRVLQQDIVRLSDRVSGIGTGGAGGISDDRVRDLLDAGLGPTRERLDALDGRTTRAEATLAGHATDLGRLSSERGQLDVLTDTLGGLRGRLDQLGLDSERLDGRAAALEGALAGVDARFNSTLDARLSDLPLGALGARVTELEGGLGAFRDKLGALGDLDARFAGKAALDALGASLGALGAASSAQGAQLQALSHSFVEAGAGLDDLAARVGKVEGATLTLRDWRSGVDSRLDALATLDGGAASAALAVRIGDLEAALGGWNTWRTGTLGRLDALEIGLASESEARGALGAGLTDQAALLAGHGEQLSVLHGDLTGLAAWRDQTAGSLETLGARAGALETWREGASSSLDALSSKVGVLGQYGERLAGLETRSGALETWRGLAEGQLGGLANKLGAIDGLQARVSGLEDLGLNGLAGRVSVVESATTALRDTQLAQGAALEAQGAALTEARGALAGLSKDLGVTRNALTSLGESFSSAAKTLDLLSAWRTNVDAKLNLYDGRQAELGQWQLGVDGRLATHDQATATLPALSGRLGALEVTSKNLTTWQAAADPKLGALTQWQPSVEGRLATHDQAISALPAISNRLGALETTSKNLTTWQTAADQRVGLLEGRQSALTQWQTSVDGRLATYDQTLSALPAITNRLGALETTSKSLTTWQTATDATLGQLQVSAAKTNELAIRLDKVDTQLLRVQPNVNIPIRRPG